MFETGLSDFHKLVVTVLTSTFPKWPSKIIAYRGYKNFSNDLLRDYFKNHLKSEENMTLEFNSPTRFTKIFIGTRNKHAPIKKNTLAETTQILLRKAYGQIMLRSRKIFKSKKVYNKSTTFALNFLKKYRNNTFK